MSGRPAPLLCGLWLPTHAGLSGGPGDYLFEGIGVFQIFDDLLVARSPVEALLHWVECQEPGTIDRLSESQPGIEVLSVRLDTPFDLTQGGVTSAPTNFRSYLSQAVAERAEVPFYLGTDSEPPIQEVQ